MTWNPERPRAIIMYVWLILTSFSGWFVISWSGHLPLIVVVLACQRLIDLSLHVSGPRVEGRLPSEPTQCGEPRTDETWPATVAMMHQDQTFKLPVYSLYTFVQYHDETLVIGRHRRCAGYIQSPRSHSAGRVFRDWP
jgi:hypothetical protein